MLQLFHHCDLAFNALLTLALFIKLEFLVDFDSENHTCRLVRRHLD